MIALVYETHSTTTDNEAGIATGWLEGRLSDRGRKQAKALGERRRDDGIAAVYTSDLGRAVETARIAFSGTEIPVLEDRRLRECNYGELNGRPVAEIDAMRLDHVEEPFPGGESYRDVVARTRSFLGNLPGELNGGRIVLIAHSANRWALQHLLEGKDLHKLVIVPFDWQEGWLYRLDPGEYPRG